MTRLQLSYLTILLHAHLITAHRRSPLAMRTRRGGGSGEPAPRGPAGGVKKRKATAGMGVVLQRRVVLGRSSSRAEHKAREPRGSGPASQQQQQSEDEQQEEQPGGGSAEAQPAAAAVKRRRQAGAGADSDGPAITSLSTEALQAIFLRLAEQDQQGYCR